MAGKMGNKLVVLCTVALGAVYATGYVVTKTPEAMGANALAETTTASQLNNSSEAQGNHANTNTAPTSNSSASTVVGTGTSSNATANTSTNTTATSSAIAKTASSSTGGISKKTVSNTSNQKYLDGTYHGSGTSRIGTVWVAVTIKSGKIANVQITRADTHYPTSYIDPVLPQEAIQRQSASVDFVSGATLSSYDFSTGVQQALQQAQNPHYKA